MFFPFFRQLGSIALIKGYILEESRAPALSRNPQDSHAITRTVDPASQMFSSLSWVDTASRKARPSDAPITRRKTRTWSDDYCCRVYFPEMNETTRWASRPLQSQMKSDPPESTTLETKYRMTRKEREWKSRAEGFGSFRTTYVTLYIMCVGTTQHHYLS